MPDQRLVIFLAVAGPFAFVACKWFWYTFARGCSPFIGGRPIPRFPLTWELRCIGADLAGGAFGLLLLAIMSDGSRIALIRNSSDAHVVGLGQFAGFVALAIYMAALSIVIVARYVLLEHMKENVIAREAGGVLCFASGEWVFLQTTVWVAPDVWSSGQGSLRIMTVVNGFWLIVKELLDSQVVMLCVFSVGAYAVIMGLTQTGPVIRRALTFAGTCQERLDRWPKLRRLAWKLYYCGFVISGLDEPSRCQSAVFILSQSRLPLADLLVRRAVARLQASAGVVGAAPEEVRPAFGSVYIEEQQRVLDAGSLRDSP